MNRNDIHVEIVVNGKPVRQYQHNNNTYVEARDGTEYSVKIKNNSYGRKLAVITVDGLNVITGQPQPDSVGQGYIVNAHDSLDVRGFRYDQHTVGSFKFCKKSKSYCNEKGLKGNNGVIGVRVYDEIYRSVLFDQISQMRGAAFTAPKTTTNSGYTKGLTDVTTSYNPICYSVTTSFCDTQCSAPNTPDFDVGTTWGKSVNESVQYVDFEPQTALGTWEEFVIYYDTRENLEGIGIVFRKEKQINMPKAFGAFATPPKGWRG